MWEHSARVHLITTPKRSGPFLAQTEKQRIIWAYKILFLDVLFPLSLRKVIFMDSDQIIRADVADLWHMDIEVYTAANSASSLHTCYWAHLQTRKLPCTACMPMYLALLWHGLLCGM